MENTKIFEMAVWLRKRSMPTPSHPLLRNSVKSPARKFRHGLAIPSALMKKCQSASANHRCMDITAPQQRKIINYYISQEGLDHVRAEE